MQSIERGFTVRTKALGLLLHRTMTLSGTKIPMEGYKGLHSSKTPVLTKLVTAIDGAHETIGLLQNVVKAGLT